MARILRSHQVLVRVTFNKPCSSAFALAAVKDCVHGEFYPSTYGEPGPDAFTVRSVTRLPKRHQRDAA